MEHLPINDLPNELLEMIFDHLDVDDLKNASLVCRRWLDLAFSGGRMDRVMLVPTFPWDKDLFQSSRKYRHLELTETDKCSAHVKELFQAFSVTSLRIKDKYTCILHSSLRSILLEVPNLQHLSFANEPVAMNEMTKPLPVMRKLERLEMEYGGDPEISLPWHTIAPSVHGLKMDCNSKLQFEPWRLLSGQLKHVYVTFEEDVELGYGIWDSFCQMTFPLLEELSIKYYPNGRRYATVVNRQSSLTRHEFFRRNTSLRRLRLYYIHLSIPLVEDITNHSKKLTYLEITGNYTWMLANGDFSEPESLASLSQLPELKHLRLDNLGTYIFRGCEALTSLQSLSMNWVTFDRTPGGPLGFLEHLFQMAPQLRCLELGCFEVAEKDTHFICNNFTNLTCLQLTYSGEISCNSLSEIDRLPLLQHLELSLICTNGFFIGIVPQNKVRYLTLDFSYIYGFIVDDILQLPEMFPQLDRLNLNSRGEYLHQSTVDRLRKLLPNCAIKLYGCLVTDEGMKRYGRKWQRGKTMRVWQKEWVWNKPDE